MHPVINIDEKIGQTMGRRIKDSREYGFGHQELLARIREDAPFHFFPGVFLSSAPWRRLMHGRCAI